MWPHSLFFCYDKQLGFPNGLIEHCIWTVQKLFLKIWNSLCIVTIVKSGFLMLSSSQLVPSGSKLQQVAANGSGKTNENDTVHFKEWVTAILSVTKTDALLPGVDGYN